MARQPNTYVAFLRGINVGGNALISMAKLKEYFEQLGYTNVSTYINSGNVIFQSTSADARKLERSITKALVEHFNRELVVVVVDMPGIDGVVKAAPKSWTTNADERRDVLFLHHAIDDKKVLEQFSPKPDIDSIAYVPRAVFWTVPKSLLTKSSSSKFASSPVYKQVTIRTFRTVQKVQTIMHKTDES